VPWTSPLWLRKLDLVREEHARATSPELLPTERFRLACELMAFALNSLRRQAQEEGCRVSELLFRYEQATERFFSRDVSRPRDRHDEAALDRRRALEVEGRNVWFVSAYDELAYVMRGGTVG
jgi:hypothetical protein